jgi:hypothetical protein
MGKEALVYIQLVIRARWDATETEKPLSLLQIEQLPGYPAHSLALLPKFSTFVKIPEIGYISIGGYTLAINTRESGLFSGESMWTFG